MLKKSTLVLSTVGVISTVAASSISSCDFDLGNCTGYVYEDISAAFLDCYDANGVLASRKEAFFPQGLHKECNSTDGASLAASLGNLSVSLSANVTNATDIQVCDYFTFGQGYEFSQVNHGVGLVVLQDRYNTSSSLYYQNNNASTNVTAPSSNSTNVAMPNLQWNWSELQALVAALTNIQCQVSNATSNMTVPSYSGNYGILAALNLPWADWSQLANLNLDFSSWTKAELKQWIYNYVSYFNALQSYISSAEATLSAVTNGIENVAENYLSDYTSEISSGLSQARGLLSQGASLIVGNLNISGAANFTDIWSPNFDLNSVTVGDIKNDLNVGSNVVSQAEGFFTEFFVNGGISAIFGFNTTFVLESENGQMTNISSGVASAENAIVLTVSDQVEAIIQWITINFNSELSSVLAQYNVTFSSSGSSMSQYNSTDMNNGTNMTNGTDMTNGTNATNGTNGTDMTNGTNMTNGTDMNNGTNMTNGTDMNNGTNMTNGTGSGNSGSINLFLNYSLPSGCAFTDASNDTVRCQSGNSRGVTFTIAEISQFYGSSALEVCDDVTQAYSSCQSNTVIDDLKTCLRLTTFNKFQLAQESVIYGWLSYDLVASNAIFGRCQTQNSGFNATNAQFQESLAFDFPNLN